MFSKLGFQVSEACGLWFALIQKTLSFHPDGVPGHCRVEVGSPVGQHGPQRQQQARAEDWLCAKQLAYVITRDLHHVLWTTDANIGHSPKVTCTCKCWSWTPAGTFCKGQPVLLANLLSLAGGRFRSSPVQSLPNAHG